MAIIYYLPIGICVALTKLRHAIVRTMRMYLLKQRSKQITFIITLQTVQHSRQSLQAHARVNNQTWQARELRSTQAIVLHEHQTPKLNHLLRTGIRERSSPIHLLPIIATTANSSIIMDLSTRSTRPLYQIIFIRILEL